MSQLCHSCWIMIDSPIVSTTVINICNAIYQNYCKYARGSQETPILNARLDIWNKLLLPL